MKFVKVYDYQIDELDEILERNKEKLNTLGEVIGELVRVYKLTETFYQEGVSEE